MNRLTQSSLSLVLFVCGAFSVAGCHSNQPPAQSSSNAAQDQAQSPGSDPADANLAPANDASNASSTPSSATVSTAPSGQTIPADDSEYNEPATATASTAPPPLPDYSQPPAPGDGYIWTPGYWAWGSSGYYWVPGTWVEPPYEGALWTPGYWGYTSGRYKFYPGHWGTHIGFYGGINYGFGYSGAGFEGGYWKSGHFYYNRDYNNVGNAVHNVYAYRASSRENNRSNASFNGGSGVHAEPGPAERAAWHQPVAPRMSTQVQHAERYQSNREQSLAFNHGRPANPADNQPVRADRNVRPAVPQAPPPAAAQPARRSAPPERPAPDHRNDRSDQHKDRNNQH